MANERWWHGQAAHPLLILATYGWQVISLRGHQSIRAVPVTQKLQYSGLSCPYLGSMVNWPEGSTMRELLLQPLCLSVVLTRNMCSSSPIPFQVWKAKRTGSRVLRLGEVALPLSSCSPWDSRPCTSPKQRNSACSYGVGTVEPGQRA